MERPSAPSSSPSSKKVSICFRAWKNPDRHGIVSTTCRNKIIIFHEFHSYTTVHSWWVGGFILSRNLLEGTEAQRTVDVTNFLIEYLDGCGGLHV